MRINRIGKEGLGVKATLYTLLDTEQEGTGLKNKGTGHGDVIEN